MRFKLTPPTGPPEQPPDDDPPFNRAAAAQARITLGKVKDFLMDSEINDPATHSHITLAIMALRELDENM